eukprot:72262_1
MLQLPLLFTLSLLFAVESQTDVSSFGIVTSSDSISGVFVHLSLILSWNTEQWECIIQTTIEASTDYGCRSTRVHQEATLITSELPSKTYAMKLNLIDISTDTDDLLRIEKVTVSDDDNNVYEISDFCVPKPFSNTKTRGTSLELAECCYWSDKHKYNDFALGTIQNNALKMVYLMFRGNVLNHPNQALEGAIKPPMISKIGINILPTSTATSNGTFALTLHWDSEVYEWNNLRPSSINSTVSTFTQTFTQSNASCEFSSGFSLKIQSSSSNAVGIDQIIVIDETNASYNIDYFCNADNIQNRQKYGALGTMCGDEWSSYEMYEGFMYSGLGPIYYIWSDDLFLNINTDQQAFALNDSILSNYNCTKNAALSSKVTIFKDDMNDPSTTGWMFTGRYTESTNAVNCPGGSADTCSRIAGSGTMATELNISHYANVVIQFDMKLSSMTVGTTCDLYYTFDGNASWNLAQSIQSTSTAPVLYANQTFNVPDHINSGHSMLGVKFVNNAKSSTDFCWLDHIYVFGDYLIAFDNFDTAPYPGWTVSNSSNSSIIESTNYCLSPPCIYIDTSGEYAERQYNNINRYNNLVLSFDADPFGWDDIVPPQYDGRICTMSYSYDDEPYILVDYIPQLAQYQCNTFCVVDYDIPDATVCGATVLKIKFSLIDDMPVRCSIDNIKLWGNVLQTAYPTASPTASVSTISVSNTASLQPILSTTVKIASNRSSGNSSALIYWMIGVIIVLGIVICGAVVWRRKNKKGSALRIPLLLDGGHEYDLEGGVELEGARMERHEVAVEGGSIHLMDTLSNNAMPNESGDKDVVQHINKLTGGDNET